MNTTKIKLMRVKAGLTQQGLAEILGVTQGAVTNWENNISHPTSDKLPAIAKALHCTIDELYDTQSA